MGSHRMAEPEPKCFPRRDALKRAAVIGAVAWSTPIISSVRVPAFAASPESCGLSIEPTDHDYGDVQVNDSKFFTFKVTNNCSTNSGTISSISISNPRFAFTSGTCDQGVTDLGPGANCTIEIGFYPTSTGPRAEPSPSPHRLPAQPVQRSRGTVFRGTAA